MSFVPPHSLEAEQAVIGGILLDSRSLADAADVVTAADFYRRDHRELWGAIMATDTAGEAVDMVTVGDRIAGNRGELMVYMGELVRNTPSAANVASYAKIVRDKSVERAILSAATDLMKLEGSTAEKLDAAQRRVLDIGGRNQGGPELVRDFIGDWINALDQRYHAEGDMLGISTGLRDLDDLTQGLCGGDLVVLAGRPSMGKTALAMNIVESVLIGGATTAVFSLEMPKDQLLNRMISSLSRTPLQRVRTGKLLDEDWPRVTAAMSRVAKFPLYVDDSGGLTIAEMRARCRRLKQRTGLGLVVVDYLQMMEGRAENRTQVISEISRGLKGIARELDVPVIALSQLNRSLEQRPNKRPRMSDLRESGQIEQDADLILFAYREEVYNEDTPDKGVAELIVSKQRNGGLGNVLLAFLGHITRFENLAEEQKEVYGKREPQGASAMQEAL